MDYNNNVCQWNYTKEDIAQEFRFFNVLKDGRVHVITTHGPDKVKIPPSDDQATGVKIKDVEILPNVAVRVFLPSSPRGQLPVLLYVHGGGFCMSSALSVRYTRLVTNYVAQCNVLAVSVNYRLFPVLENIASQDPWIKHHADLKRIFVVGDSVGGNICHTLVARAGKQRLPGEAKVEGMILIHPYFSENDKMWMYMCPTNEGPKDPRMKPSAEDLAALGCGRVLVLVAEKDELRDAGEMYVDELSKSGWKGSVEFVENKDKEHCFHLGSYLDQEAVAINQMIKSFINHDRLQG